MSAAYQVNPQDLLEAHIDGLRALAKKLESQVDRLEADNAYLTRENEDLWSSVRERDNMIRELQEMSFRGAGE